MTATIEQLVSYLSTLPQDAEVRVVEEESSRYMLLDIRDCVYNPDINTVYIGLNT